MMTKSKIKAEVGMVVCKVSEGMTDDGYEWIKGIKYDKDRFVHEVVTSFTSKMNEMANEINTLKGIIGNQQELINKQGKAIQELNSDLNELQKGAL